jgi:dsRNA-specific ribonuclease
METPNNYPHNSYFGSPKWLPKQTSEEKCQQRLLQKLLELKKQNVLRRCFLLESNEFEVLEFYGDAYLYERVSYFIMTTRRFMDPNLMTKLRCSCIKNANLAAVFEQLKLAELLEPSPVALTLKSKADILEAIIGELAEDSSSVAEDLLSALIAYIAYMGDKEYFQEANAGVVSLGEGITTTPKKAKGRRRQRSHKDSGNNNSNRNADPKTLVNTSNVASANQKHPLFILTTPKPPGNGVIPNMQTIKHPERKSEPIQMNGSHSMTLSFITPTTTTNGREPSILSTSTSISRSIYFHKMNDVSTSSESSSSSTSLSSSPMNLFLLPNTPVASKNLRSFPYETLNRIPPLHGGELISDPMIKYKTIETEEVSGYDKKRL